MTGPQVLDISTNRNVATISSPRRGAAGLRLREITTCLLWRPFPSCGPCKGQWIPRSRPRREVGVSGLQWKIGWLDPGLLMLSEVPPHICRVLGAQEGDLHGDKVRCYVPLNNLFEIITLQKVLYHTQQTRSTE